MNLGRLVKRLVHGGSSHLDGIEMEVVEAVLAQLPEQESQAIRMQLEDLETVQKAAGNRMVCMWYRGSARSPLLEGGEFCLARLRIAEEKVTGTIQLMVHRGRLQSFEYSRGRPGPDFTIRSVEIRPAKVASVAAAIDRLEHDEPNDDSGNHS
ncbi:hypothetical protein OJ996_23275 [Luteolibacter sp. GHJ8]|uniref:Uncharacterized protein n=1 Tax=Luteolibacter rhizosphaerae TaxID=2989719 RepID=A0ABT3G9J8_9BACT|nr:hypothetical protein [Luteolibacter rhizosphaerae]MCW1916528.1 hypothetical protein [Luteolibacter rhizosphaerae]